MIDADGNVGIGTATPGGKLEIDYNNGGDSVIFQHEEAADIHKLTFIENDFESISLRFVGTGAAPYLSVYSETLGTDVLVAHRNTGNIGIGTPTPTSKLHLIQTTPTTDILTISDSGSGTTATGVDGLSIDFTAASDAASGDTNSALNISATASGDSGDSLYGLNIASAGISAGTLYGINVPGITAGAGTEYALNVGTGWDRGLYVQSPAEFTDSLTVDSTTLVVNASGYADKVGIGTAAPQASLDIETTPQATHDALRLSWEALDASGTGKEQRISWYFGDDGSENAFTQAAYIAAGKSSIWTTNSTRKSYLSFATHSSGVMVEAMRIVASGNVGIGTTTPGNNVAGTTADEAGLSFHVKNADDDANIVIESGDAAHLDLIDSATTANERVMRLENNNGMTKFKVMYDVMSAAIVDNVLVMDHTNGNVGIGDTSPDQLLEVLSSGAANTQLSIGNTNAGDYDSQIGFELADGTNTFTIGVDDSDSDKFKISTTALGTNDRFVIDADGKVGIGTATPGAQLHINGTSEFEGIINTNSNWISGDGGAEGIKITTNGHVGINVSPVTSDDALTVNSNGAKRGIEILGVSSTANSAQGAIQFSDSGNEPVARIVGYRGDTYQSGDIAFEVMDDNTWGESLRIDESGNVGIGTATPGSLLTLAEGATAANGISFGTDTNLYRSAANTLKTDDNMVINGSLSINDSSGAGGYIVKNGSGNSGDITIGSWTYSGSFRITPNIPSNLQGALALNTDELRFITGSGTQGLHLGTWGTWQAGAYPFDIWNGRDSTSRIFGIDHTGGAYFAGNVQIGSAGSGTLSVPGSGPNTEQFGAGATSGVSNTVSVGRNANAGGNFSISL